MRGKIAQGLVERLMILRATVAFKNNLAARIKTCREINEKLDGVKKEFLLAAKKQELLPSYTLDAENQIVEDK